MAAPMSKHGFGILCAFRQTISNIGIINHHRHIITSSSYLAKTKRQHKSRNNNKNTSKYIKQYYQHQKAHTNFRGAPEAFEATDLQSRDIYEEKEGSDEYYIPRHIHYHTLRESDSRFGPIVTAAKNRKQRELKRIFLLESRKLVLEAVNNGVHIRTLFFTKGELLEKFPLDDLIADETELFKVKMSHMQLWSSMVVSSGMMAICDMPVPGEAICPIQNPLPFTLICDNIEDKANLGLLLRSAAAAGCQQVLLAPGCGDPWDVKTLRAACGGQYHLPILPIRWELVAGYLPPSTNVYLMDGNPKLENPNRKLQHKFQWLISQHERSESSHVEEFDEETNERIDESFKNQKLIEAFSQLEIPSSDYFSPDFTSNHSTLIVSGEASGEAKKLAHERHGERLCVPFKAGIGTVNCAIGGSLVMFELNRQHSQRDG